MNDGEVIEKENLAPQALGVESGLPATENAAQEGDAQPTSAPEAPLFSPPAANMPADSIDEVNLPFISIKFQSGPVPKNGVNGVQAEDLIDVLIARVTFLDGKLPCVENQEAIKLLNYAKHQLEERTRKRVAQGIEGTDAPHV